MTEVATVLRDRVRIALQGTDLADAAVIPRDEWAQSEEDGGHVFDGDGGYIHGRNRGRTPFIEFWISQQGFDQLSATGGLMRSTVQIRLHVGGRVQREVIELASTILDLAVTAIRSISGNYADRGSEDYGSIRPGPWGHQFDVTLSVMHAVSR